MFAWEIIDKTSSHFTDHSVPWSLAYDRSPQLVLVPSSIEHLQAAVQRLCELDVDFAVRGRGVGSSSARDVILSMRAFDEIKFDENSSTVVIGAGLDWGQVDEKLATLAPGYVVIGARCPYVGVTGSTLHGGLSWLSHEFGLGSDPANMLDAQIVTADGRAIWASEEPDLLWALRGGGGNFGVACALRLRAHRYTSTIWSGMIFYPPESLAALSRGVAKWVREKPDPKMALHLFVFDFSKKTLHGEAGMPELCMLPFDARGEDHARSDDGFKWALDIPGATRDVKTMRLAQVHELQRSTERSHGTAEGWLEAALINEIDDLTLVRACEWYVDVRRENPDLAFGTFALLEIMQKATFSSTTAEETAWPHGGKVQRHVLQLSVGGPPGDKAALNRLHGRALDILRYAPSRITGKSHPPGDFLPNFLLYNHDLEKVFEGNWDKLRAVKAKYDPRGRFNKGFFIPPAEKL